MFNCEENGCENFQSAICLHCHHRLCISHIQDHQNTLLNQFDQIKTQIDEINTLLTNNSNKILEQRQIEERNWRNWRKQKVREIEEEYSQKLNSIRDRQKKLEQLEKQIQQRLQVEIQQPFELMSTKKNINFQLIDNIQSTMQNIKQDIDQIYWDSNDINNAVDSNNDEKEKPKESKSESKRVRKAKPWKPRNLLCTLFHDVSRQSTQKIKEFVQTMENEDHIENNGLITLVFSYLSTWHNIQAKRGKYKELVLNKHLLTIKQFLHQEEDQRKVLIALQYFFNRFKHKRSTEIEMMNMLLEFFFSNQLISINDTIDWYLNDNFVNQIVGRNTDKTWALTFLNKHGFNSESQDCSSNQREEEEEEETTSVASKRSSIDRSADSSFVQFKMVKHVRLRKPFNNLVKLFKTDSDGNDQAIHQYINMQYKNKIDYRVLMVVRSYLKGWMEYLSADKDQYLSKKISIIKYYQSDNDFQMQILYAIEIFIFECKKNEKWSIETISMLFKLFLDDNCIAKETFLKWYSDRHPYHPIYYTEIKRFAQPFIQTLIESN